MIPNTPPPSDPSVNLPPGSKQKKPSKTVQIAISTLPLEAPAPKGGSFKPVSAHKKETYYASKTKDMQSIVEGRKDKDALNLPSGPPIIRLAELFAKKKIETDRLKDLKKEPNQNRMQIQQIELDQYKAEEAIKIHIKEIEREPLDLEAFDNLKLDLEFENHFADFLMEQLSPDAALKIVIACVEKEVHLAVTKDEAFRQTHPLSKSFIASFQKYYLLNAVRKDVKEAVKSASKNPLLSIQEFVKKIHSTFKKGKELDRLKPFYQKLCQIMDKKFPGEGKERVLSLIMLKGIQPLIVDPSKIDIKVEAKKSSDLVALSKTLNSCVNGYPPENMLELHTDEARIILKEAHSHLIEAVEFLLT